MATNLSKAELIEAIAKTAAITKVAAAAAIKCALGTISAHVGKGGKVTLVGFGTFRQRSRKARTGRNPQTGAAIKIAASKTMSFKPSKSAKTTAPKKSVPKAAAKAIFRRKR